MWIWRDVFNSYLSIASWNFDWSTVWLKNKRNISILLENIIAKKSPSQSLLFLFLSQIWQTTENTSANWWFEYEEMFFKKKENTEQEYISYNGKDF